MQPTKPQIPDESFASKPRTLFWGGSWRCWTSALHLSVLVAALLFAEAFSKTVALSL